MKNLLISIIIVAGRNRKKEIMRCIASIYRSTYRRFEIIVTNNSQDPQLLKDINKEYPDVRIIELIDNTGVYGFNIGFANAKGDYILGIDDDCAVRPNTLANFINSFEKKPKEVGVIVAIVHNPLYKHNWNQDKINDNIINRYSFFEGASAFRREVFEKVGYYDKDFFLWQHGDDLSIRILSAGFKIHFDKNIIIDHYHHVYHDNAYLRNLRAYYDFRNFSWFMLKHFSPIFFPVIICRNAMSFINLVKRYKSFTAIFYAIFGYLSGWLTFYIPLKKRKPVPFDLQKRFMVFYLFDRHIQN